jgi:hypothetical protein
VGQDDNGKWIATEGDDGWEPVVTANSEDEVWDALDSHAGGGGKHVVGGKKGPAKYPGMIEYDPPKKATPADEPLALGDVVRKGNGSTDWYITSVHKDRPYPGWNYGLSKSPNGQATGAAHGIRNFSIVARKEKAKPEPNSSALKVADLTAKERASLRRMRKNGYSERAALEAIQKARHIDQSSAGRGKSASSASTKYERSGSMPTAATVKPGDIVAPSWASDYPKRVDKVGKITASGRVTIFYEDGSRQTYKINERLIGFKVGGKKDFSNIIEHIKRMTADERHNKPCMPGTDKFPIGNVEDLQNAIRLAGHSNEDQSKVRRWIKRRARQLGREDLIPEDWQ